MTSHYLNPDRPARLLAACPVYKASPLNLHDRAPAPIWIKDETDRMRLGAFKALGGVYAVASMIAEAAGIDADQIVTRAEEMQAAAETLTFVCASAGNHGIAVAAGAQIFGAQCRIHLADTVPPAFDARVEAKGAKVVRRALTYEASIDAAIADAEETGAIHLADGSWTGYTEPPRLVMEGYTVLSDEMADAFRKSGQWPSDVYLQAGVGGLAGAIAEAIRTRWDVQPRIIVVEPDAAPCLKESMAAGKMVTVNGPVSAMGRLDCKTPSLLAFEILRTAADAFETVSEAEASAAVRIASDLGYTTTPSGAAGLAAALRGTAKSPLAILSEGAV